MIRKKHTKLGSKWDYAINWDHPLNISLASVFELSQAELDAAADELGLRRGSTIEVIDSAQRERCLDLLFDAAAKHATG